MGSALRFTALAAVAFMGLAAPPDAAAQDILLSIEVRTSDTAEGSDELDTVDNLSAVVKLPDGMTAPAGGVDFRIMSDGIGDSVTFHDWAGIIEDPDGRRFIAEGESEHIYEIQTHLDDIYEPTEMVRVTLAGVSTEGYAVDTNNNSVVFSILDANKPTVSIAGPSLPVNEGGTHNDFTVTLTFPDGTDTWAEGAPDFTLPWSTADDTATSGDDYTPNTGSLSITRADHAADGTITNNRISVSDGISVTTIDDDVYDLYQLEVVNVTIDAQAADLSMTAGASLTAGAIILDDEEAPTLSFGAGVDVTEGDEGTSAVTFDIMLSGECEGPVNLRWSNVEFTRNDRVINRPDVFGENNGILANTGGSGDKNDFESRNNVMATIPARTTTLLVSNDMIIGDYYDEESRDGMPGVGEKFYIQIADGPAQSDGGNRAVNPPASADNELVITIQDDDTAGLELSMGNLTVQESSEREYTVALASQPTETVTIVLTRDAGGDESLTVDPDRLTFTNAANNWRTPQTVTVKAAEDADDEDGTATFSYSVDTRDDWYNRFFTNSPPTALMVTEMDFSGISLEGTERTDNLGTNVGVNAIEGNALTFTASLPTGQMAPTGGLDFTYSVQGIDTMKNKRGPASLDDWTDTGNGMATILAGENSVDISIAIDTDTSHEPTETLTVTLVGISTTTAEDYGVNMDPVMATITDANKPMVAIDDPAAPATEGTGAVLAFPLRAVFPTGTNNWAMNAPPVATGFNMRGTATAGDDYTAPTTGMELEIPRPANGTITGNEVTFMLNVPIIDDAVFDSAEMETLSVNVFGRHGVVVVSDVGSGNATGTIIDDESPPVLSWTSATFDVLESAGNVTGTVTATLAAPAGADAGYTIEGNVSFGIQVDTSADDDAERPATIGTDYLASTQRPTFPAGSSLPVIVPYVFQVYEDEVDDDDETFVVSLGVAEAPQMTSANGQMRGFPTSEPTRTTITIVDNEDALITIAGTVTTATEGENLTFTVSLGEGNVAPARGVGFEYAIAGASAADWTDAGNGMGMIPAGQRTAEITLALNSDNSFEATETLTVTLEDGGRNSTPDPNANSANGTILDGNRPTMAVNDPAAPATEGTDTRLTFPVTLTFPPGTDTWDASVPRIVDIIARTRDGTATSGSGDYGGLFEELQITRPGNGAIVNNEVTYSVNVNITDDMVFDGAETEDFQVFLDDVEHFEYTGGGTGMIVDNDDLILSFTPAMVSVDEGAVSATVRVSITDPPDDTNGVEAGESVTVTARTVDGTATNPADYTDGLLQAVLTTNSIISVGKISANIVDDGDREPAETFTFELVSAALSGGRTVDVSGAAAATVTIESSDQPSPSRLVSIAGGTDEATEGENLTFTASLPTGQMAPTGGIAFTYSIAGRDTQESGEAEASAADWTDAGNGTGMIPAGERTASIMLALDSDNSFEATETLTVTLTDVPTSGYWVDESNDEAAGTIIDNNRPTIAVNDPAAPATEGTDPRLTFPVTLTFPAGTDTWDAGVPRLVDIVARTEDGTATSGDYAGLFDELQITRPGNGAIVNNEVAYSVNVGITDDTVFELRETENFQVVLDGGPLEFTGEDAGSRATGRIVDNEPPPVLGWTSATFDVPEGAGLTNIVTALLAAPAGGDGQPIAGYATEGEIFVGAKTDEDAGTATAGIVGSGDDYVKADQIVTFAADLVLPDTQSYQIQILDDEVDDDDETIVVTLGGPPGPLMSSADGSATRALTVNGIASATVTILDNEDVLISLAEDEVLTGTEGDNLSYTVAMPEGEVAQAGGVAFEYTIAPSNRISSAPASVDDWAGGETGTGMIPAGASSVEIVIRTQTDTRFEHTETFTVTLSRVMTVNHSPNPSADSADGAIIDDNRPTLSIGDAAAVTEGTDLMFPVTLTFPAGTDTWDTSRPALQLSLAATGGTAMAGADFPVLTDFNAGREITRPANGTITGNTVTAMVNMPTTDDTVFDSQQDDTLTVEIGSFRDFLTVVSAEGTGTIQDNDNVTLSFTPPTSNVIEEPSSAAIVRAVVTPTAPTTGVEAGEGMTVIARTVDGTATKPADYTDNVLQVTLAAGATSSAGLSVDIVDDTEQETDETFTFEFVSAVLSGGRTIDVTGAAAARITIRANDEPVAANRVSIAANDGSTAVEGNNITFDASLPTGQMAPAGGVAFEYTIAGSGTVPATASDWDGGSGTGMIAAGQNSALISFAINSDTSYEPTETLTVTLARVTTPLYGFDNDRNTARGTITDANRPVVSVRAPAGPATEGVHATLDFPVTLTFPSGTNTWAMGAPPFRPIWFTADGTATSTDEDGMATADPDFTDVEMPLLFSRPADGVITNARIQAMATVDIVDDARFDSAEREQFTVSVIGHSGLLEAANGREATGTIIDNEPPPVIGWTSGTFSISEAHGSPGNVATITIAAPERGGAPISGYAVDGSVVVEVGHQAAGTATLDEDYQAPTGDVVIANGRPGRGSYGDLSFINDEVEESDETFSIRITGTPLVRSDDGMVEREFAASGPTRATVTIIDNDGANAGVFLSIAGPRNPGVEGRDSAGTLTYTVRVADRGGLRITPPANTLTLEWEIKGVGDNPLSADDLADCCHQETDVPTNDDTGRPYTNAAGKGKRVFGEDDGSSVQLHIATRPDNVYEPTEQATIEIDVSKLPAGYALADPTANLVGEVRDDNAPRVAFDTNALATPVEEGANLVIPFRVDFRATTWLESAPAGFDVAYFTTTGNRSTATQGSDFTAFSRRVARFTRAEHAPDGVITADNFTVNDLVVATRDDDVFDSAEVETVAAVGMVMPAAGMGAVPERRTVGFGRIMDNDDPPTVSFADDTFSVVEGDAGTTQARLGFIISGRREAPVTATFSTMDGTATEGTDYTAATDATVTFPGRSNRTQFITVDVTGDDASEDDETFTATLTGAVQTGPQERDVALGRDMTTVTIENDDIRGVIMPSATEITVVEGDTAMYTVALDTPPDGAVTVVVVSDDTALAEPSPSSLTFTAANYNVPQTVTVTVGDDNVENTTTVRATLSHVTIGTGAYMDIAADVSVFVADDERPRLAISPPTLTVTEASGPGNPQTYTVRLTRAPADEAGRVTVTVTGIDPSVATVAPTSLTFNTGNYNVAQTVTVTGVDDDIDNRDDRVVLLTHAPAGSGEYSVGEQQVVTVIDDEVAGISASPDRVNVPEGGEASYTLVLDSRPGDHVTVMLAKIAGGDEDLVATPDSLTFLAPNWNVAQTVTVTAADDSDRSNGQASFLHTTRTGDVPYDVLSFEVDVVESDNDISIGGGGGISNGPPVATAAAFTFLAAQDFGEATIGLGEHFDDAEDLDAFLDFVFDSNGSATLTTAVAQYSIAGRTLTITSLPGASGVESIVIRATDLGGLSATKTLMVTIGATTAQVAIAPDAISADEAGGMATYTVALLSEPSGNVTVTPVSGDVSVATVSGSLTFTTDNWSAPQTVTVTGVDDGQANVPDRTVAVSHEIAGGGYDDAQVPDVTFTALASMATQSAPVATAAAFEFSAEEDFPPATINLGDHFDDAEDADSDLAFTFADDGAALETAVAQYAIDGQTLTITSVADANGEETITVRATDRGGLSATKDLAVTVTAVNDPPVAVAGADQTVNSGTTVTLDGSGSTDPEGDALTYAWTQTGGRQVILSDSSATPTFIAPNQSSVLAFTLTVTDSGGATASDGVTVRVRHNPALQRSDRLNRALLPQVAQAMTDSAVTTITGRLDAMSSPSGCGDAPASVAGFLGFNDGADMATKLGTSISEGRDLMRMFDGRTMSVPLGARDSESGCAEGSIWATADYTSLDVKTSDTLDWDGELKSIHLGADKRFGNGILAGVALTRSKGEFDFTDSFGGASVKGIYETGMTSVNPYVSMKRDSGLALWLTLGYGQGDVEIDDEAGVRDTDMDMLNAAFGGSGSLLRNGGSDSDLRLKMEMMVTRLELEDSRSATNPQLDIMGMDVDTMRLRVAVEGHRRIELAGGGHFTPSVELGLRQDSGDGLTGQGVELGGGLNWTRPDLGLTVESRGRVLLTHNEDYDEWGVSGTIKLDRTSSGRGFALSLESGWGETASGMDRVWSDGFARYERDGSGGTASSERNRGLSLDAEVSYGFTVMGMLMTPYTEYGSEPGGSRRYSLGNRVDVGTGKELGIGFDRRERQSGDPQDGFLLEYRLTGEAGRELGVQLLRREGKGDVDGPVHGVLLEATLPVR